MGIGSVNQQNESMVLVTVLFILVSVVPVKPFPSTFTSSLYMRLRHDNLQLTCALLFPSVLYMVMLKTRNFVFIC